MIKEIKKAASEHFTECLKLRRHFHKHPELSFNEFETSSYIQEYLQSLNVDEVKRIDKTGVLGIIKGRSEGKTTMLRSDIDALPIKETNAHSYRSVKEGVMHACGHDAHTAMLLTAAKILNQIKNSFDGTIKILFQPAEERIPGGASLMIKNNVLKNPAPASVLGQHVMPQLASGKIGIRPGMFMASADEIYIKVLGKGGHAAMPERLIDPVVIASNIIMSMQQLVSRVSDPKIPSVLSFGRIIGEGAPNVIPDGVFLEGTFRTLDEKWRAAALKRIKQMAISVAKGMGGQCEVEIRKGYPSLHNDAQLTGRLKENISEYVGVGNLMEPDIWMAAEDFAYYSQQVPSAFYLLGVQNKKMNIDSDLHTSTFDIDEKALEIGSGLLVWLAIREVMIGNQ